MSLETSTTMELLTAGRRIIRTRTRTSGYWSAAERLSRLWAGDPLLASAEFHIAAGSDLAVIDWLYDESIEASESAAEVLVGLTRRFQGMANLETATRQVRRLEEERLCAATSVEDATCAIIALLTAQGVAALTRRGSAELASRWQRAWADFMWRQSHQQQRICGLGILPRLTPDARRRCMETVGLRPEDLVLSKPDLDTRLRAEWMRISPRLRDELCVRVSSRGAGAGTATAATIVARLSDLLDILVPGTWKQGVSGLVPPAPRSSIHLRDAAHAAGTASLLPLIRDHFQALITDRGDWNHSIYDMAWVLCCGFFKEADRQKHLARMLSRQGADGTWGDASYMPHSALVDTLAAVMALVRMDRPVPRQKELRASVEALLLRCCDYPHHDTVAFELLVPKLLAWLEQSHFTFPLCARARGFVEDLDRKGDQKLHVLRRAGGLFEAGSTVSFAAEIAALVPLVPGEVDRLLAMMLPNGAIGLSPAATAAVCMLLAEQKRDVPGALYQYLRDTFDDYSEEGFPNAHPIVTSRRLWNVRSWLISGNIFDIARDEAIRVALVRIYEETNVDEQGRVSWDTNNRALPDLDDTAVAFALYCALRRMGAKDLQPMTTSGILRFRRKDGTFFCYPHEMHPSPSALLHSLLSLELGEEAFGVPLAEHPDTRSISRGMLEQLRPEGQSFERIHHDKWHATWTYGAQKWLSLRSVRAAYPAEVKRIFTEVMAREHNGGWGQKAPTLEETAYVVSGLSSLLKGGHDLLSAAERANLRGVLERSRRFMSEALSEEVPCLPAFWISKNMYTPRFQIVSAVLDALYGLASLGIPCSGRHPHEP